MFRRMVVLAVLNKYCFLDAILLNCLCCGERNIHRHAFRTLVSESTERFAVLVTSILRHHPESREDQLILLGSQSRGGGRS